MLGKTCAFALTVGPRPAIRTAIRSGAAAIATWRVWRSTRRVGLGYGQFGDQKADELQPDRQGQELRMAASRGTLQPERIGGSEGDMVTN